MYLIFRSIPHRLRSAAGTFSINFFVLVLLIAGSAACTKSDHEHLAQARQHLASSDYAQALASAESGLEVAPGEVASWGLELVKLEAHARAGQGAEAKNQLEKLAGLYPKRVSAAEYSATAQQLQAAGQGPLAIEVLDLGAKRYPDDSMLAELIAESVSGGGSPAELEMLKSLGYIE